MDRRIICWDLDETLGEFTAVGYQSMGEKVPGWVDPPGLRYGIRDLLQDLSRAGYEHYVTTGAMKTYADKAIRRAKLSGHFKAVFDGNVVAPGWGKLYKPVAVHAGLSNNEMAAKMIVIGNSPGDSPIGVSNLVFIHDPIGIMYDSEALKIVLDTLVASGKGNFRKGFECLHKDSQSDRWRRVDLGRGIEVGVEYKFYDENGEVSLPDGFSGMGIDQRIRQTTSQSATVVPTITPHYPEDYRRELELID